MRKLRTGLSLGTAAIVAIALPATAGAEYLVPPSNSAATQYTETLPTAGGHGDTEKASKGRKRSPAEVLGTRDAKKLDQQGQSGQEVAEFTAETAPAPSEETTPPASEAGGAGSAAQDKSPSKRDENAGSGAGAAGGKGGPPGPDRAAARPEAPGPEGSSGLSEVIAQATGSSSSGQLGLLLPLALVAALAWALAFLWRQHNRPTV
ncbi:MAG TPA: hypothetical protein VFT10_02435 [Solirubrobacterales bacterium]|nr:hypothetical protein [Solirubrobacterales bacterium]